MKTLLPLFLPFLLLACSDPFPVEPVSKTEALALAARIDSGIRAGKENTLNLALDEDLFAQEVARASDKKFDKEFIEGIKEGIRKKRLAAPVIAEVNSGGSYEFVRQYEKEGKQHIIFRLYGISGLNYHDFTLAKRRNMVRARDMYIMLTGEPLSKSIANLSKSLVESNSVSVEQQVDQMKRIQKFFNEKRYKEARQALYGMPADVRKSRIVQVMNINIASEIDTTAYTRALAEFESLYGSDPAAQFALFDHYFKKGDYNRVQQIINEMDSLMQDPMLDFHRALVYKQSGNIEEVTRCLERLNRKMPDFEDGAVELVANYLERKDVARANKAIAAFKANDKFSQSNLEGLQYMYPKASAAIVW